MNINLNNKTIEFKIFFLMFFIFIILFLSTYFTIGNQLNKLLNQNYEFLINERLNAILTFLDKQNKKISELKIKDENMINHKNLVVKELKSIFYNKEKYDVFPFIIDSKGNIIIDSIINKGDTTSYNKNWLNKLTNLQNGNFTYIIGEKEIWFSFKYFRKWDWIVGYAIPYNQKYKDSILFEKKLGLMLGIIFIIGCFFVYLFTLNITKPIIQLTKASVEMSNGNLDYDFIIKGKNEISIIADNFKKMRDTIKEKIYKLEDKNIKLVNKINEKVTIQKNQEELINILESTTDFISTAWPDGKIMYINKPGKKMVDLPEDVDVNNLRISDFHTKEALELIQKTGIPECMKNRIWEGETDIISKTGKIIPVSQVIISHLNDEGQLLYLSTIVRDISKVKENEKELKNVKKYLQNVIDSMPSIVIGVDSDGIVTHWNKKAEIEEGIQAHSALNKKIDELLPEYCIDVKNIKQSLQENKIYNKRLKLTNDNQSTKFLELIIYPLDTSGIQGAVIKIDDISEKVKIQDMMLQTEKMMSIGGLAAGMAHEINNPLSGILQGIQNTFRRIDPDDKKNIEVSNNLNIDMSLLNTYLENRQIINFLKGIQDSAERATKIVRNMLEFSRKSSVSKKYVDIKHIFDKAVELASNDYNLKKKYDFRHIKIKKEYSNDNFKVFCIQQEIEQVILNLLNNSAQAMSNNKTTDPEITLSSYIKEDNIIIEVKDNGPGMSETVKKRIFEPFFTTKKVGTGTGLGLSVSYFILKENHDGDIFVDSEIGKGTKFTLILPNI